MAKIKPRELASEAHHANLEQVARLGAQIRASRRWRRLAQRQLGVSVGLHQSTVSLLERGEGGGLSVDTWQRLAIAIGRPLRLDLPRDPDEEPADAGHLAIQEVVLRTARAAGYGRRFELSMRPSDPSRSTDVGLINGSARWVVLVECINTLGNLGESVRSSDRKRAEAEAFAATLAADDGPPFRVGSCWILRDVERNRALVRRYPEILTARFPGSSLVWLRALSHGTAPPAEPGLIWCDGRATRLFAARSAR